MNTSDNSPEYYRMREAQEQEMADKAATEEGRAVHQALADRYRELAEEVETQGPKNPRRWGADRGFLGRLRGQLTA